VLALVFPCQAKRERLRNELFCVEWDVKPQLNQSNVRVIMEDGYFV